MDTLEEMQQQALSKRARSPTQQREFSPEQDPIAITQIGSNTTTTHVYSNLRWELALFVFLSVSLAHRALRVQFRTALFDLKRHHPNITAKQIRNCIDYNKKTILNTFFCARLASPEQCVREPVWKIEGDSNHERLVPMHGVKVSRNRSGSTRVGTDALSSPPPTTELSAL